MATGFVLVRAAPTREKDVFEALRDLPETIEVHPLFGEFDLIVKIEAPDFDALGHVIVAKVRSIPGIVDTKTFTETSLGKRAP